MYLSQGMGEWKNLISIKLDLTNNHIADDGYTHLSEGFKALKNLTLSQIEWHN